MLLPTPRETLSTPPQQVGMGTITMTAVFSTGWCDGGAANSRGTLQTTCTYIPACRRLCTILRIQRLHSTCHVRVPLTQASEKNQRKQQEIESSASTTAMLLRPDTSWTKPRNDDTRAKHAPILENGSFSELVLFSRRGRRDSGSSVVEPEGVAGSG